MGETKLIDEYWFPHEIRFTKKQVLWLLPHLEELREGIYPVNHQETGYIGASHQHQNHSPFENICLVAAELDIRMAYCFPDGILLEGHYTKGISYEDLGRKYHRDVNSIERNISNALGYISSGPIQRWHDDHKDPCIYEEWKGHYRLRKNILGIIPARGGSERIPLKNICLLGGISLLVHTIKQAQQSKYIQKIIISTEHPLIADVARQAGIEVIDRPVNLAMSSTPTLPVLQHALKYLEQVENFKPSLVVLLQVTSPLRTPKDIDCTIKLVLDGLSDSAETRCGTTENGAVYVMKPEVLKRNQILSNDCVVYQMPSNRSIDIDTEEDFRLAERMLKC